MSAVNADAATECPGWRPTQALRQGSKAHTEEAASDYFANVFGDRAEQSVEIRIKLDRRETRRERNISEAYDFAFGTAAAC
jgi:hypothetical protein